MAALGERDRELGEPRNLSPAERAVVWVQAKRVVLWSVAAGLAMMLAAVLVRTGR